MSSAQARASDASANRVGARSRARAALAAILARGPNSAVWRLTAAFALPLFLGMAVLLGGAYALIVRADAEAVQAAATTDADDVMKNIRLSLASSTAMNAAYNVVDGRLYAQSTVAASGQPVTSFYRMDVMDLGADGKPVLAKQFGDRHASLTPLECPWWAFSQLSQCFGGAGRSGQAHWWKVTDPDLKDPDWGLAERLQITAIGAAPTAQGTPAGAPLPPIYVYVGRKYGLGGVRRSILGLAGWTLGAAGLAALGLGLLVSLQMLRRVEAVNQVCDRVMQGDLTARAEGETAPDEFGELSRHVNTMLEQINGLVLGLRDVSNRIAHDLRTPIARLRGHLQDAAESPDLTAAHAGAEAAVAETDEILATFQALLDIAEVEAGAGGGLQPMRLDEAAAAAIDLYDAVAEEAGVTLEPITGPVRMLGEPTLVVRLAANLVDNAIKFSPRGGVVRVGVSRRDGEAVITVSDQGPGIPAADRDSVMRRFIRGAGSAQTPGHGLGLALVAAVAKRHGAKIRMSDNAPGLVVEVAFKAF